VERELLDPGWRAVGSTEASPAGVAGKEHGAGTAEGRAGFPGCLRRTLDAHYGERERKGAALSGKTARKEYGLTQDEIIRAIQAGELQYREGNIDGAPWLRLLRREVEALVAQKRGEQFLPDRQTRAELARIDRELKRLKAKIAGLEERKARLLSGGGK
jgi:hypothetical protein